MNLRKFHNWLKGNTGIKVIHEVFMVDLDTDELCPEKNHCLQELIFKINENFWFISVNHEYDDIDIKIRKKLPVRYEQWKTKLIFKNLIGARVEQVFIGFNFNLYTDSMKLKIIDNENQNLIGVLSLHALSNIYYVFRTDGVDRYL